MFDIKVIRNIESLSVCLSFSLSVWFCYFATSKIVAKSLQQHLRISDGELGMLETPPEKGEGKLFNRNQWQIKYSSFSEVHWTDHRWWRWRRRTWQIWGVFAPNSFLVFAKALNFEKQYSYIKLYKILIKKKYPNKKPQHWIDLVKTRFRQEQLSSQTSFSSFHRRHVSLNLMIKNALTHSALPYDDLHRSLEASFKGAEATTQA